MNNTFQLGQLVHLTEGRTAIIRFIGQTHFASGDWVGVEFADALGKNDGSVKGHKYFECSPGHGMFLRTSAILEVVEEPTPRPEPATAVKDAAEGRDTLGGAIDNSLMRRRDLNAASPTPGPKRISTLHGKSSPTKLNALASSDDSSRVSSPAPGAGKRVWHPPTVTTRPTGASRNLSNTSLSSSTSAGQTRPLTVRPQSLSKTPLLVRPSIGHHPRVSYTSATSSVGRSDIYSTIEKDDSQASLGSVSEDEVSSHSNRPQSQSLRMISGVEQDHTRLTDGQASSHEGSIASEVRSEFELAPETGFHQVLPAAMSQQHARIRLTADARHIEELEIKLRLLEKKRADDREKLKTLDSLQAERDRFQAIIQKLQNKFQPQQQELAVLRSQLRESESKLTSAEAWRTDNETALEMATLDREMAEETSEVLRAELETLKEKVQELEEEVQVLREENEELGQDMSTEERTSQGWLQMERSNERLKEALVRLRDMTQSQESELKDQVFRLRSDLEQLNGIRDLYNVTKEKLRQSDDAIEDLRQQLDAALGAEYLIEELTGKNLDLAEQIDKFKAEIEELEDLRELNDQLVLGHEKSEWQLEEELERRDVLLAEQYRRATQKDERLAEHEYTIAKFRGLVTSLQSHLDDMKASKQITEADAEELNSRSRAMADLNIKLHDSIAKGQLQTVDVELRRLDAQEAEEHLKIVQSFLPDDYTLDRESILTYLKFQRIAFKARLMYNIINNQLSEAAQLSSLENVLVMLDIMGMLTQLCAMCGVFIDNMRECLLDKFRSWGGAVHDLESVEHGLSGYIDAWKRGELKGGETAESLRRYIVLLSHLNEIHINPLPDTTAPNVIMLATLMQGRLELITTALTFPKMLMQRSEAFIASKDDVNSSAADTNQLDSMIMQSRSSRVVASKVLNALQELKSRSMTMNEQFTDTLVQVEKHTSQLFAGVRELGEHLQQLSNTDENQDVSSAPSTRSSLDTFQLSRHPETNSSNALASLADHLHTSTNLINSIFSLIIDPSQHIKLTLPQPPWILRATSLKSANQANTVTASELTHLKSTLQSRLADLHHRDQTIEEQALKLEVLESRMQDATAKAAKIQQLHTLLESTTQRSQALEIEVERVVAEARALREERDRWKVVADRYADVDGGGQGGPSNAVAARELRALQLEVRDLRGAVRRLRSERRSARYGEAEMAWLREPLVGRRGETVEEAKRQRVEEEGMAVLHGLLDLVAGAEVVRLEAVAEGGDRLAWRPVREKSAWVVARRREEWMRWRQGGERFLRGAAAVGVGDVGWRKGGVAIK